jgi:ABC-2 type transport system permease protein
LSATLDLTRPKRIASPGLVAAFIRRDWAIARSYRLPFIFDVVQSLFSLVLVYFLAKLFTGSVALKGIGDKAGYFGFAVIGLAVLGVLTTSLVTFAERLRTDQTTGTLETVLATPTPAWLMVLASAAYELLFSTVSAAVMLVAAVVIFGLRFDVNGLGVPLALLAFIVSISAFASLGLAYAAFVMVFKQGNHLLSLVGVALSLFSGVYFPVKLLPTPLRLVSEALPITQGIAVLRQILLANERPWGKIGILAATAAVFLPLSLMLLDRAINRARRAGTLGQF